MAKNTQSSKSPRIVNRKARHDYHILETLETGIVLLGSEVKSIRNSHVSLAEGYARIEPADNSLYLYSVDISPYQNSSGTDLPDPKRRRKLLAHKRQIERLFGQTTSKGTTLIPLALYFVNGRAKVEIGVATGKKTHDKRQTIKQREADREIRAGMARKRI